MLFDDVFKNPKWQGKDDFPSTLEWKNEFNKWLLYAQSKGQLSRYVPRLNDSTTRRDETFAEIFSAYILETHLKYSVIDWERKTVGDRDVDFVIEDNGVDIFCEVKSPGWESELEQKERLGGRKDLPKHLSSEGRFVAPWRAVRYAIKKSYNKFLPERKNLLIIKDDLFLSLFDIPGNMDIALYEDVGVYDQEKGYFVDSQYENIEVVLFLNCINTGEIKYQIEFKPNNNAKVPFVLNT